ncbi:MAG: 30S ribosomal protein S6e [Nanoarchaeota archaeon]
MVEFKLVINDTKTGKSYQREVKDDVAKYFIGKKINEKVLGDNFNFEGYEFLITGGSDNSGFPMRKDVDLAGKRKIFAVSGVGIKKTRNGMKIRKTVAGNTIYDKIVQINLKILKYGKEKLEINEDSSETKKEEKNKI